LLKLENKEELTIIKISLLFNIDNHGLILPGRSARSAIPEDKYLMDLGTDLPKSNLYSL
jgi:hypothetical protein